MSADEEETPIFVSSSVDCKIFEEDASIRYHLR